MLFLNVSRIYLLHEATKDTAKSHESWHVLVTKLAASTIKSMENQVSAYEEKVRSERERRNEKSWDFCTYFLMQVRKLLILTAFSEVVIVIRVIFRDVKF